MYYAFLMFLLFLFVIFLAFTLWFRFLTDFKHQTFLKENERKNSAMRIHEKKKKKEKNHVTT